MSIFAALEVYRDDTPRAAAMNMAIDEALLQNARIPSLRLYRWDHSALSFGYFGKIADVAGHAECDLVRRWTGGGIVLHGEDLTYSIVIPATDPAFAVSTMSVYEKVHQAIQNALIASGQQAELAKDKSAKISESCFANPVRADVLLNGEKVAGAAQRKTRAGLLQQGSIQNVALAAEFAPRFAAELAPICHDRRLNGAVIARAQEIAAQKYATEKWLRRR